jgi:two-component system chemotaxis response regulator CheB
MGKMMEDHPDVLIMRMENASASEMELLKTIQEYRPMPIIALGKAFELGSEKSIQILKAGAFDVVHETDALWSRETLNMALLPRLREAVRFIDQYKAVQPVFQDSSKVHASVQEKLKKILKPTAAAAKGPTFQNSYHPKQIIVMGASTGGTEALREVLTQLPSGLPPILIVQHIPAGFSKTFAERLNSKCNFEVREASFGDRADPGTALVAPGGYHMEIQWKDDHYWIRLHQGPEVHHQRPAVDILFHSAAECAGNYATAVLLTGMGIDGALGMKSLKEKGARTLAQDEASCVVYGMPKEAVKLHAVDRVVSLKCIPQVLLRQLEDFRDVKG